MACYYHPEARNTATCPECQKPICDRCRLNGNSQRCGTCQSIHAKGGSEETRTKRTMCLNHASTPTDTVCKQCRKPHCVACLNGAQKCFRCAMAANRTPTGPLKAKGTGKLDTSVVRGRGLPAIPPQALGGGVAAFLIVLLLGYGLVGKHGPASDDDEPFLGKSGVAIVAPAANALLHGPQTIKLAVASKEAVEKVEIAIDGKPYGAPIKHPPFETDWPTPLFKNGPHVVEAVVRYRGGRRLAADRRRFTTKNRQY